MTPADSKGDKPGEEKVLGEMFVAAREEQWDARAGFEERLVTRLAGDIKSAPESLSRLIWKVVPAAAAVSVVTVIAGALTGSFSNLDPVIYSNIGDPFAVEKLMILGLFI